MTDPATPEHDLPRRLVDTLVRTGALRSPRWIKAFSTVPRHVFVPRLYVDPSNDGHWQLLDSDDPAQHARWLETVYADESLVIQLDGQTWLSSSSQPSLMAAMLEALILTGSERVLEIGTGTGWNAALLAEGLGSDRVVSIDIDEGLVDAARERLHGLGYGPVVAAADAVDGFPARAAYDRVLSTVALPDVPASWLAQTTPGGLIMVNLYRDLGGGAVALLQVDGHTAHGQFLPFQGWFMPTRNVARVNAVDLLERRGHEGQLRPSAIDANVLADPTFLMFAALRLPGVQRLRLLPDGPEQTWLLGRDGSWAYQAGGDTTVHQGGPDLLWDRLENIHHDWVNLNQPRREGFGLTVDADGRHTLWYDTPDGTAWAL